MLYHANTAARSVPQSEFLSSLYIPDWITINNLFEKFKARKYSLDASLIYILAERGFPELIRTRLKQDPEINVHGERYKYPLFAALTSGNKDSVAALLNLPSIIRDGVDITEGVNYRKDLGEYEKRTPLSWAAQTGRTELVKLLLQRGMTVNGVDRDGQTPLLLAFKNGHEAVVRLLVDRGADVNVSQQDRSTPLLWASRNSQEIVARLLIDRGADVNASHKYGSEPLLCALQNGHEAVARVLIEKGAQL